MVSGLEKIDRIVSDAVHEAMFLGDAARPTSRQDIYQRFGLAWAFEGVSQDRVDKIQHSDCRASIGFDPETEVFAELGLKYCDALTVSVH